jgi:peptide/nickel transport system substrate-binding protein
VNRRLNHAAHLTVRDRSNGLLQSGLVATRRDVLRYAGGTLGLASLGMLGLPELRASAQEAPASAVMFNDEGTPPTEATGELTVALQFDPVNLDSIATYTLSNAHWEGAVYSALTFRDPNLVLYDGLDGRPSPAEGYGLAESWEYADDLTLNMKLKSGITFHDGSPLNADAVRAHFARMADPANASPQAFNYASIESVEVVDDLNLIFHFSNVDPVMITKFAGYGAYITSPTAAMQEGFGTATTSGTGPYRVVEYVKDEQLTLEAWDGFWGAEKPLIKTIIYRIIPNDDTRLAEFMAGSVDVFQLNVNQAGSVGGNPELEIVQVGSPTVMGLRLDAAQAPTDNKDVRNAIANAIDLQTIIDTIVSGYGTAVSVWQSPFSFGYDESLTPYAFDPELAKQHIANSGLPTPIKLTYDILSDDSLAKEFADAVKGMLDPVGFETEIRIVEQATYYDDYRAGSLGNVVWFGWGGWTLDFDNTYFSMMKTGESYNPSYSNPQVDALLDEQRGTLDQARRLEIAKQINQLLYEDAPDVALWQTVNLWGVNTRVHKFQVPGDDRFWWDGCWVE